MADINITCPECDTVTVVSEFVDDANLKCISCGITLKKPGAYESGVTDESGKKSPGPETVKRLRMAKENKEYQERKAKEKESLRNIMVGSDEDKDVSGLDLRPEVKAKTGISHAMIAGLLFLVLGGIMGYLRYGGILPENIMEMSLKYSWIIFLLFHFVIVLKAMTDNMMQGILSLLIPGYSLYYLFAVSDEFYFRAIVAAVLIGIGQDAAVKLKVHAANIFDSASEFISSGGGETVRR